VLYLEKHTNILRYIGLNCFRHLQRNMGGVRKLWTMYEPCIVILCLVLTGRVQGQESHPMLASVFNMANNVIQVEHSKDPSFRNSQIPKLEPNFRVSGQSISMRDPWREQRERQMLHISPLNNMRVLPADVIRQKAFDPKPADTTTSRLTTTTTTTHPTTTARKLTQWTSYPPESNSKP